MTDNKQVKIDYLQKQFEIFKAETIHPDAPAEQVRDMGMAFFGGAAIAILAMRSTMTLMPDIPPKAFELLESLMNEAGEQLDNNAELHEAISRGELQ